MSALRGFAEGAAFAHKRETIDADGKKKARHRRYGGEGERGGGGNGGGGGKSKQQQKQEQQHPQDTPAGRRILFM